MWMPDWLYERLPLLYLAAGAVCLWVLGTSFATAMSALMFFAAGLLAYGMRRSARRRAALRLRRRSARR